MVNFLRHSQNINSYLYDKFIEPGKIYEYNDFKLTIGENFGLAFTTDGLIIPLTVYSPSVIRTNQISYLTKDEMNDFVNCYKTLTT